MSINAQMVAGKNLMRVLDFASAGEGYDEGGTIRVVREDRHRRSGRRMRGAAMLKD